MGRKRTREHSGSGNQWGPPVLKENPSFVGYYKVRIFF
jgi:hypothetical protein